MGSSSSTGHNYNLVSSYARLRTAWSGLNLQEDVRTLSGLISERGKARVRVERVLGLGGLEFRVL